MEQSASPPERADPTEAPIPQQRIDVTLEPENGQEGPTEKISIIVQKFADRNVVNICSPHAKSFGSIINVNPPSLTKVINKGVEHVHVDTSYLLGESNHPEYDLLASQLMRHIINCGILKALLITINLGENERTPRKLKAIVDGIKAKKPFGEEDISPLKAKAAAIL